MIWEKKTETERKEMERGVRGRKSFFQRERKSIADISAGAGVVEIEWTPSQGHSAFCASAYTKSRE